MRTHLKVAYGLSLEERNALMRKQFGCCAICGISGEELQVDHNHSTGHVRGLLCQRCNKALGLFKDDPCRVSVAHMYLLGLLDCGVESA